MTSHQQSTEVQRPQRNQAEALTAKATRIEARAGVLRQECEGSIDMADLLAGLCTRCTHDRRATTEEEERRRVAALTNELRNAVFDRQDESRPLTEDELTELRALRAFITNLLNR